MKIAGQTPEPVATPPAATAKEAEPAADDDDYDDDDDDDDDEASTAVSRSPVQVSLACSAIASYAQHDCEACSSCR